MFWFIDHFVYINVMNELLTILYFNFNRFVIGILFVCLGGRASVLREIYKINFSIFKILGLYAEQKVGSWPFPLCHFMGIPFWGNYLVFINHSYMLYMSTSWMSIDDCFSLSNSGGIVSLNSKCLFTPLKRHQLKRCRVTLWFSILSSLCFIFTTH